ncbi:hypothetical protein [Mammaliicoccus sciuri]|uniref:hypothetical protein n=1 Tax=Mammaliicoccus sciuri TaxID=1296 RepID=UPI000E69D93C|nr:hypothetical protein [Mammaliicoccus sciuri]RIN99033.1 hypothetical protein BU000_04050 [Mammaliicoccus sciuri]
MKKLLVLLFASLLVLSACGEKKEESSSKDDTKETKKEVKKNEPKKKESDKDKTKKEKESAKKSEPKTQEKLTEESTSNEQQSTEEVNSTEQATQEQQTSEQPINSNEGPYSTDGDWTQEQIEENERLAQEFAKNNPDQIEQQSSSSDNPYMDLPNQEWRNNTGTGLSSGEMQLRNEIKNGTYEGDDGDQILEALDHYEQQYGQ